MSELKEFNSERIYWAFEQVERVAGDIDNLHLDDNLFYIKSEADKVIALLTDKANYNDYAYKHKSEELADTCRFYEEELRHQKYKRCLAMATICRSHWAANIFIREGDDRISEHYMKWEKRWLKLAEKFKEAKK